MELDLKNKVVIVTGATGGIGAAIVKDFLEEGSIVFGVYRGDGSRLKEINEWLGKNEIYTKNFHPLSMDITEKNSVAEGIKMILGKYDRIDVLVNCAGFSLERPFLMTEEEEWEKSIEINLSSCARLCRHVLKPMFKQRSGAIINISSIVGARLGRGNVAYASAKGGLNRFTQALAMEVGAKGIRVNAVCPGVIETKMSTALNSRFGEILKELTPLQRVGQSHEVAKAVLFLASERTASYITGSLLYVDGGTSI